MKHNNKATQEEVSPLIENAKEEPLEYFMSSQSFGFQFCYSEAQENFAENLVEEVKEDE